jgi:hypothetical protein
MKLQSFHGSISSRFFSPYASRRTERKTMKTACNPVGSAWRGLYTAALFETDKARLPSRIAQAEAEIVKRVRELFSAQSRENVDERNALDRALSMLRALSSCVIGDMGARL